MTGYHTEETIKEAPKTFTNHMRILFKDIIDEIGRFLNRFGFHPNTISIIGLFGNFVTAVILAIGHMTIGGFLALVMGLLDVVDGTMARLRGESTKFGAFLDSVIDRYSELSIFLGLSYYFAIQQNWQGILASYLAAAGSVLVSYIRARAQSLGLDAQVGLLTRLERYIVLIPALIFNQPLIGVLIIAVLANLTAIQRIYYVWKRLRS
jgi:CDP-diacylglycerol--glycerol-3-phosphate 3-phosphatidyltransferase